MSVGLQKSTFSNLAESDVFFIVDLQFPQLDFDFTDDEVGVMVSGMTRLI